MDEGHLYCKAHNYTSTWRGTTSEDTCPYCEIQRLREALEDIVGEYESGRPEMSDYACYVAREALKEVG